MFHMIEFYLQPSLVGIHEDHYNDHGVKQRTIVVITRVGSGFTNNRSDYVRYWYRKVLKDLLAQLVCSPLPVLYLFSACSLPVLCLFSASYLSLMHPSLDPNWNHSYRYHTLPITYLHCIHKLETLISL